MAKLMKELAKQMTASLKEGNTDARVGLENALKERHITVGEWNLGDLFRECFGTEAFDALRYESAHEVGRFLKMQEAAGGVSTAAFANINKPFAYTAFLEPYQYPQNAFMNVIPKTTLPSGSVKFLRIPGVTNIGRAAAKVKEGEAYKVAGVSENFIETPEVQKYGFMVPVTKEAIFFDRTGQVVEQCRKVGESMALSQEYQAIACVVDAGESEDNGYYRYRWGKSNTGLATIATYGDSSGTHNWDNLAATNALTDYNNLDTAWQLLLSQTDPFTGEPIYFEPKHLIYGPNLAFKAAFITAGTITKSVGGFATSGDLSRTEIPNPSPMVVGNLQAVGYNSRLFQNINTTASAATTWYLGDLGRAFGYLEAWPARMDSLGAGSEKDFEADIVMQFKGSRMGTYYTKEPRCVVKCTA